MKYKKQKNTYIIRLFKGEKIIEALTKFLTEQKITSAYLLGIGAVSEAELAHYDLEKKKYSSKKFNEQLEIINMTGNIALLEGKPMIHTHIALGDKGMKVLGGHLKEATVAATCEIILKTFEENLEREHDPEIGLNLLKL